MGRNPTIQRWLETPKQDLDGIFGACEAAGEMPVGFMRGVAIICPGGVLAKGVSTLMRWFAWQGKVFDPRTETLINSISLFRVHAIRARVYKDASWMDQREAIIIDYSDTSFVAKKVRDEIREIEPGVFLGKVWWGKTELIHFALCTPG